MENERVEVVVEFDEQKSMYTTSLTSTYVDANGEDDGSQQGEIWFESKNYRDVVFNAIGISNTKEIPVIDLATGSVVVLYTPEGVESVWGQPVENIESHIQEVLLKLASNQNKEGNYEMENEKFAETGYAYYGNNINFPINGFIDPESNRVLVGLDDIERIATFSYDSHLVESYKYDSTDFDGHQKFIAIGDFENIVSDVEDTDNKQILSSILEFIKDEMIPVLQEEYECSNENEDKDMGEHTIKK